MRLDVYLHFAADGALSAKLESILGALNQLNGKVGTMTAELDDVVAKVTAMETVQEGAITLLGELKTKLDAAIASGDTAALVALSTRLGADTQKLADAIVANTPAAPPPPGGGPV